MLQDHGSQREADRPVLPGAAPAYQRAGKPVARTAKVGRKIERAGTILAVEPSMTNTGLARKLGVTPAAVKEVPRVGRGVGRASRRGPTSPVPPVTGHSHGLSAWSRVVSRRSVAAPRSRATAARSAPGCPRTRCRSACPAVRHGLPQPPGASVSRSSFCRWSAGSADCSTSRFPSRTSQSSPATRFELKANTPNRHLPKPGLVIPPSISRRSSLRASCTAALLAPTPAAAAVGSAYCARG
jgi:hypothetical protein